MAKLYTFGCSFTSYLWPTWADILLTEFDGENWALPGGGNKFIFESLTECLVTNGITKDDTVIIMWSSWAREDRYFDTGWNLFGNVYNNHFYDEKFLKKYWNDAGAILDNFNWICAAHALLENIGCKYIMTSAFPFFQVKEWTEICNVQDLIDVDRFDKYFKFLERHKDKTVTNNLYQTKYNSDYLYNKVSWKNTPDRDNHPLPLQHYHWLEDNILNKLNLNEPRLNNIKLNATEMHNICIKEIDDAGRLHPTVKEYPVIESMCKKLGNRI